MTNSNQICVRNPFVDIRCGPRTVFVERNSFRNSSTSGRSKRGCSMKCSERNWKNGSFRNVRFAARLAPNLLVRFRVVLSVSQRERCVQLNEIRELLPNRAETKEFAAPSSLKSSSSMQILRSVAFTNNASEIDRNPSSWMKFDEISR
eukprot:TRINITY_DN31126_c0_g1_i2.p2 TRINITY_DN31126_c0_g1~~TRINITY_DN31126_c0_g1_i2.p2  ORF type:complete len:148 (-),score=22.12 TRINITY_DN31126_c0_g1_i2:127-570(-)